jgi:UDPglucose 6-dehydrogenase
VEAPPAFSVVSHPEFLREGSAVADFMHPDRLVFGAHDRRAAEAVAALYAGLNARVLITDLYSAEMIKYASNAFLATRISFINEVARICERVGADVGVVAEGMGLDRRIGPAFLNAGVGFGGSCFPKDVRALAHMAKEMGYHPELLDAVLEINASQRRLIVEKVRDELGGLRGRTIGVLGLSFKPDTDDIREAPALTIIQELQESGATVRCYDPVAMPAARRQLTSVTYCEDAYAVADGADALLIVTEWNEFRLLDLGRIKRLMRRAILVDGRNLYEPQLVRDLGFVYRGVGRC